MRFTKMHGCGNDYVYVNGFLEKVGNKAELARRVSDRHKGIGSDGVIFINPSEEAEFEMEMYNADGSEGKMCGNGIRCVGKYVYDHGMTDHTTVKVSTKAGIKTLELSVKDGKVNSVTVDMGSPLLTPADIPVTLPGERIVDHPYPFGGKEYRITCVSMGNPHCIVFTDDVDGLNLPELGPIFETDPIFPDRVNTEFIHVTDPKRMEMRVWERGSGETEACGTGACAAAVAGYLNGLTERKVTVKLLGGELEIEYREDDGRIYMTGEAVTVYEGSIDQP